MDALVVVHRKRLDGPGLRVPEKGKIAPEGGTENPVSADFHKLVLKDADVAAARLRLELVEQARSFLAVELVISDDVDHRDFGECPPDPRDPVPFGVHVTCQHDEVGIDPR